MTQRLFDELPEKFSQLDPARRCEIDPAIAAFMCVFKREGFEYLSTAVSTGSRLYDLLEKTGSSLDDLKAHNKQLLIHEVIEPNIANAQSVKDVVVEESPRAIIAPAAFDVGPYNWSQSMYIGLWLPVVEQKITKIRMLDGWEYSDGGLVEFFLGFMMKAGFRSRSNIDIVKQNGETLDPLEGYEKIFKAMQRIDKFIPPTIHAQTLLKMQYVMIDAADMPEKIPVHSGFEALKLDPRQFGDLFSDTAQWMQGQCRHQGLMKTLSESSLWGDVARARPVRENEEPVGQLPKQHPEEPSLLYKREQELSSNNLALKTYAPSTGDAVKPEPKTKGIAPRHPQNS